MNYLLFFFCLFNLPLAMAEQASVPARTALATAVESNLGTILAHNQKLFSALLGTDQKAVETSARELIALSKSHGALLKKHKITTTPLEKISAANPKAKNLEHYSAFLPPVVEMVKTQSVAKTYNVFYCPMIQKSWIQDISKHAAIRNVFAQEMLECGEQQTKFM
ncbi:MAG TPA: hypothetical protein VNJ01_11125 [Bacteriovoracaceae bacterium]|nr:hypothetical protein [Bacteriovoracaceae bacterium]